MINDQLNEQWEDVLQKIRERLGTQQYNTWFSQIKFINLNNNELNLVVPAEFFKNKLKKDYYELIKDTLVNNFGFNDDLVIKFNIDTIKQPEAYTKKGAGKKKGNVERDIHQKLYNHTGLNSKYIFDDFVVGNSNRLAHAACLAVAQSPAKSYNPLFIYGGAGLGKTHLLHAIGNFIIKRNSQHSINIAFVSSEEFTNELINAIKDDATVAFREKYRSYEVLLIDDIQFIIGKERTQEEFFHTFNTLYNAVKQIVITSDKPPKEFTNLEERLVSRFEWGLIADIQSPELETRIAILQKKAENYQLELSDEIINYIAAKPSNIRQLESALNKLKAFIDLTGQKDITATQAQHILKDLITIERKEISIPLIQRHTAEYFNLKQGMLVSPKRTKNIVEARHIAMYLARELTNNSLPVIGDSFGGKDHTTVIHSYNKIKKQLNTDSKLKLDIDRIKNKIISDS